MNTASVSTFQQVETCETNAGSANAIWEALDSLAKESASLAKWRSFAVDGHVIPSYVFIGPRSGSVPIRLTLLGGFEAEDFVSTGAIIKLLVEFDLAPLLARDFALFSYPIANPDRVSGRSPNSATGFWKGAPNATIRYLEREFAWNHPDGIIAAQGNEAISGFQMLVLAPLQSAGESGKSAVAGYDLFAGKLSTNRSTRPVKNSEGKAIAKEFPRRI